MKKTLACLLTLMLLCGMTTAFATEAATVEITFDGTYVPVEDFGFKIYLPNDWVVMEDDNYYFRCANEEQTQTMAIDVLDAQGQDLAAVAEAISQEEGMGAMSMMTINGILFALYEAPELNAFGAFTNTKDNTYCIHFIFAPAGDEAFTGLATQIMASVDTL